MKIYVSNLSFHTDEEALRLLFSKFGSVASVKIIMESQANRPRRYGFIEMPSESEAHAALLGMDRKEIQGRQLSVSVAKEKSFSDRNLSTQSRNRFF
jgi:RNA recognition motif-containing protein